MEDHVVQFVPVILNLIASHSAILVDKPRGRNVSGWGSTTS